MSHSQTPCRVPCVLSTYRLLTTTAILHISAATPLHVLHRTLVYHHTCWRALPPPHIWHPVHKLVTGRHAGREGRQGEGGQGRDRVDGRKGGPTGDSADACAGLCQHGHVPPVHYMPMPAPLVRAFTSSPHHYCCALSTIALSGMHAALSALPLLHLSPPPPTPSPPLPPHTPPPAHHCTCTFYRAHLSHCTTLPP